MLHVLLDQVLLMNVSDTSAWQQRHHSTFWDHGLDSDAAMQPSDMYEQSGLKINTL